MARPKQKQGENAWPTPQFLQSGSFWRKCKDTTDEIIDICGTRTAIRKMEDAGIRFGSLKVSLTARKHAQFAPINTLEQTYGQQTVRRRR
jgi:hypothetical protein